MSVLRLLRVREKVQIQGFSSSAPAPRTLEVPTAVKARTEKAIRPSTQGGPLAGRPQGHCLLAHPWKTKLSFFERNVRSYSTSTCNRDQQAGRVLGHSLSLATVSPTPTPTPCQSNQDSRPCQLPGSSRSTLGPHPGNPHGRVNGRVTRMLVSH